jgi:hypothetical protein
MPSNVRKDAAELHKLEQVRGGCVCRLRTCLRDVILILCSCEQTAATANGPDCDN